MRLSTILESEGIYDLLIATISVSFEGEFEFVDECDLDANEYYSSTVEHISNIQINQTATFWYHSSPFIKWALILTDI